VVQVFFYSKKSKLHNGFLINGEGSEEGEIVYRTNADTSDTDTK